MNEDFSEVFNKFSEILKEKNIDLNGIAGGKNPPADNSDISLDIETILKIKDILGKLNKTKDCPRNKVLEALKPYLEDTKKEKLEKYMKIANLLSVMEELDIGIDFLKKNKEGYDFILIITLFLLIF